MVQHDFAPLYAHYPALIADMPDAPETFSSHEFILALAQTQQTLYVEALYAYRHNTHRGQPAPFMMVHKELAKGLSRSDLIEHIGEDDSVDIFDQSNRCAFWRKV